MTSIPTKPNTKFALAFSRASTNEGQLTDQFMESAIPGKDPSVVDLKHYLGILLRRKWLILSFILITVLTTLVLTLAQPKQYRASATLEILPQTPKITKFEEIGVNSTLNAREYYDTQVELIQGEELLQSVIDRLELEVHPSVKKTVFGSGKTSWTGRVKKGFHNLVKGLIPGDRREEKGPEIDKGFVRQRAVLQYVARNMEVASSRTSLLIDIAFTSADRQLAKDVPNGIAEAFVDWHMEKKHKASDHARIFLKKQIDQAKAKLEGAEKALNQFTKQTGILSLDSNVNSVYRQLEELNSALAVAEADLIEKQAVYKQAVKNSPATLPEVMESPMIGQLKTEYAQLQAEYEKLSITFQDDYPAVKALLGRMKSIAERINLEEGKVLGTVKHRYEAAEKKVTDMRQRMEVQKQLAMNLNESGNQYKILEREVETNKQIYQSLLERSREIESMAGLSPSNIQIVDSASLPISPAEPNVRLNILLALAVGILGGFGIAFLTEYLSGSITDPREINDQLRIPILGLVPIAKSAKYPVAMTFIEDPMSPLSEAIRTVRVALQMSSAVQKAKSFLITSTQAGEGKTTLASNLAFTFAGTGERVVVVDADMRNPSLHEIFDKTWQCDGAGLSRYLGGSDERSLVCSNGIENIHFIPAGPIPSNPSELLASRRFSRLIQTLEKKYDRVIVDGPPNHGFADVLILSQHVGGVVLASCLKKSSREGLQHFKTSMLNINATVLGCIINMVDFSKNFSDNSYYSNYGHYGYGGKNDEKGRLLRN